MSIQSRRKLGGPVVDLSRSPHALLHPVSITTDVLRDSFWGPRVALNREVTIPAQLEQCRTTGRLENFERAAGKSQSPFQGIFFNDSDVYKWIEATAFSLATNPDTEIESKLDEVISLVADAQQPDGYLNTYFMFDKAKDRFSNLKDMHEIYCAGHLFQAAVAHSRATGKTTLLDVARRLADHLDSVFGPGKRVGACGHEGAEMGLVELYRETGEPRYLALAAAMVEARGKSPGVLGGSTYHQDHLPFVAQTELVGHAVRHLYYLCGAADLMAESMPDGYQKASTALWNDLTSRKMYITGGAGSRYEGESFGAAYELPNERAYTETCAAIASVMWNWRLLNVTAEARYADLMERTLYNAVLSGLSLDGMQYFYQNPLADRGAHRRQSWFGCACCPPNVARLLASLTGYFYSVTTAGAYVHIYAESSASIDLPLGGAIKVEQRTDYPWDGDIEFYVRLTEVDSSQLFIRIPEWTEAAHVAVDGADYDGAAKPGSYVALPISDGTTIRVSFAMPVERIASHMYVKSNLGRVALQRGPFVYCIEQTDHADTDVWDIALPDDAEFHSEFKSELLSGVVTVKADGVLLKPGSSALYSRYVADEEIEVTPIEITAIPYYAWANRDAGPMEVWIPTLPSLEFDDYD